MVFGETTGLARQTLVFDDSCEEMCRSVATMTGAAIVFYVGQVGVGVARVVGKLVCRIGQALAFERPNRGTPHQMQYCKKND